MKNFDVTSYLHQFEIPPTYEPCSLLSFSSISSTYEMDPSICCSALKGLPQFDPYTGNTVFVVKRLNLHQDGWQALKQSAFLYQFAVQATLKNLHFLSMRLTIEYFKTSPKDVDMSKTLLKGTTNSPSMMNKAI